MKVRAAYQGSPAQPSSWVSLVIWLAAIALGISAYLLYGSLTGERLPGCGSASGCNAVLSSRWAYCLGVPVSLFAALTYAVVLGASAVLRRPGTPANYRRAREVLVITAAAIVGAAGWFVGLQLFVIKAICPFCMVAHACGLTLGIVILLNAPRTSAAPQTASAHAVASSAAPLAFGRFALIGLGGVAVLGLGQVIYQPKTYVVQSPAPRAAVSTNQRPTNTPAISSRPISVAALGATNDTARLALPIGSTQSISRAELPQPETRRVLQLHGDAFTLDLNEIPLLGSPQAPCVIVDLFDYSCSHCRQLQPILLEAFRGLSNQLAIVRLPVPLATNCNRMIKSPIPPHIHACEYAKTGLAVWRANPKKLAEFDEWLFAPPRPPTPDEVDQQAMRLVGTNEFRKARSDPWIDRQIEFDVRLYETNYARYGRSVLPELLIGPKMISGVVPNVKILYQLLTNHFILRLPQEPEDAGPVAPPPPLPGQLHGP